jgi:ADP-dependent NAD(P)H-hydrate dehydratase / NAD(P)H-hydrate epimerase
MVPWLEPLYDAAGMGRADRWAIEEQGVPSLDLMEAAGRALASEAASVCGRGPVRVVCGKGNNAGDGLVAARHLVESGHEVEVLLLWPAGDLSPDALVNFERLRGIPVLEGAGALARLGGSGVVIDAVLGTGFEGEPRSPVLEAIRAIDGCDSAVVACDVPSGMNASTGEAAVAAAADVTVTFHGAKLGHFVSPGKHLCGRLVVAPIGIPPGAPAGDAGGLIAPTALEGLPGRGAESTKFTSGRVSIVGGTRGLTGAVCLAAEAAIRSGAGYATAAVPADLEPVFETKLTEVMTIGCGDEPGLLGATALDRVADHCEGAAAVVLGSGIGRDPGTAGFVRELPLRTGVPMVVDADGLWAFSGQAALLAGRDGPTVLTPHAGEMGRLLGEDASQVSARRLEAARRLAAEAGAVVVLKGDDTIVTDGDRVAVNALAAPALATAGTGDVLAGVCGAFIARGLEPFEAACAAVYCHALAGRMAGERVGSNEGVVAGDVVAALPRAMAAGTGDRGGLE